MNLRQAIARMFIIGFDGLVVTDDAKRMIDMGVGGVIFFSRNVKSPQQFADLAGEVKRLAGGRPLLTCIDQEGGRVARLRDGFSPVPAMRTIGSVGDTAIAEKIGKLLADELRAINVDFNFAPVMDVDTNPANPVIGDRSFGRSPQLVSRLGAAMIDGMQENGVAACAKHFPGHGDTSTDSHLELPRLPHDMARLREIELPPFRAAIDAGVAAIMTAHVMFDAIDSKLPATMSKPVLDGILRKELRFDGVIVSDCLQMNAISEYFGIGNAVVNGTNAGVDAFLVCHHANAQDEAISELVAAIGDGRVEEEQVWKANERIDRLAERFAKPPTAFDAFKLRTREHLALLDLISTKAGQSSQMDQFDPTTASIPKG